MFCSNLTELARRRGAAYLLALLFLALFSSLSVAMAITTSMDLKRSENFHHSLSARLAAESGLGFMLQHLDAVRMPSTTNQDNLIPNLANALSEAMNDTPNTNGQSISSAADLIIVPQITLQQGSFTCALAAVEDGAASHCRLTVTGTRFDVSRSVSINLTMLPKASEVFDYGIASHGKIYISGSALIEGINHPTHGNILSARPEPVAIEAAGHATITGDLFLTGKGEEYVYLKGGGFTIAGTSDLDEVLENHVHAGVDAPRFPPINVSQFAPLTTMVIDSETVLTGSDLVFNNPRVAAGTNPDFHNDTTINGVLFIEVPNKVIFHAATTINGIIVTEDGASSDLADNQIDFRGHVSAPGVGALPDGDQFDSAKQLTGTILLAPGFGVTFRGSTNTVNGVIAADQFSFRGASTITGKMTGSIIGLKDLEMTLQGDSTIRINRDGTSSPPAGFIHGIGLVADPESYVEGVQN